MLKHLKIFTLAVFLFLSSFSWAQAPTKLVYQHRLDDKPKLRYTIHANQKVKLEIDTLVYAGRLVILSEDSIALDSHRWHVDQLTGITHKPRIKNVAPIICAGIGIIFMNSGAVMIRRNPTSFLAQYYGSLMLYTGAAFVGTGGALVWGNTRRDEYMNLKYFELISLPKL